jgi:monofunctional biosynthetic peptidoglycan transglycosylase
MNQTIRKIGQWCRNGFMLLFVISLFFVIFYKYVPVYYTNAMFARNVHQLVEGKKIHTEHHWKPLSEISPEMEKAVIASEDYWFLVHNGFDTGGTGMSATISQQTARNVFLPHGNGFFNEILETYFTVLIEFVWGKERILEVYLNSVEMGDCIFGTEAIAQKAFQISAKDLDEDQSALIAACLGKPAEMNPAEPTMYILRRQAKIKTLMLTIPTLSWRAVLN